MTESQIKKRVYQEMEREGYVGWTPAKVKYQKTDIFGLFDGIFFAKNCSNKEFEEDEIRFIQWTTKPNISARLKKIKKFYEDNELHYPAEIWGWDIKKKKFDKRYL